MLRRFVATIGVPLRDEGFPSYEQRVAATDPAQTVKGMFFEDLVSALGPSLDRHLGELIAPPRDGRFVAFRSYPLRDHAVLAYHASRELHPEASMREGLRRMHRGNLETLARSTVGKVLTALSSDVKGGFAKLEEGFRVSRSSGRVRVLGIEDRAVEVRIEDANPWLDCSDLGTLEGLGAFYGRTIRTEVELESDVTASFVCRWRD